MVVVLDGKQLESRETLHAHLARELAFPAWYGGNLDALFDCLTDLREETEITLCNVAALKETLGGYADVLLRVLREAAEENHHIRVRVEES